MKKLAVGIVAILAFGMSGLAQAEGAWTGRVGALGGPYKFKDKFTDTAGNFGPPGMEYSSEDGNTDYGILLGTTVGVGRFFGDLGTELTTYAEKQDVDGDGTLDNYYRSDILATLGAYIGDRWTAFAGYRDALFGTRVYSEKNGDTEKGPFVGGGVSFRPGDKVAIGVSLAYNFLKLSFQGQTIDNFNLNGLSGKVQASLLGTPHSVFLRWQHFKGDTDRPGVYAYEYTEDYVNVGYQATFDFKAW